MDRLHTRCIKCKKGYYEEAYFNADKDGILHCTNCGHWVYRHDYMNDTWREESVTKRDKEKESLCEWVLEKTERGYAAFYIPKDHEQHPNCYTQDAGEYKYCPECGRKIIYKDGE